MVNLWPGVDVKCLCDKHLNAAINEGLNLLIRHHIAKGHKIDGWIKNGCIPANKIMFRISELLDESKRRGKKWSYQFTDDDTEVMVRYYFQTPAVSQELILANQEAIDKNVEKLSARCARCKEKIENESK